MHRKKAGLNMDGQFLIRQIYEDEITYNLITAAVEILSEFYFAYHFRPFVISFWRQFRHGEYTVTQSRDKIISFIFCFFFGRVEIPADDILELFGKTFFDFCQDSGYDKILQVLGATPRDFLQVCWNSTHFIFIITYACHIATHQNEIKKKTKQRRTKQANPMLLYPSIFSLTSFLFVSFGYGSFVIFCITRCCCSSSCTEFRCLTRSFGYTVSRNACSIVSM